MLTARLEFHLVHEVLDTHSIQYAIRVYEQDEEVVVAFEVLGVHAVDELERAFLAGSLAAVWEAGYRDARAAVDDIDAFGVRVECEWDAQFLNCVQI